MCHGKKKYLTLEEAKIIANITPSYKAYLCYKCNTYHISRNRRILKKHRKVERDNISG